MEISKTQEVVVHTVIYGIWGVAVAGSMFWYGVHWLTGGFRR